jgi:hypothetical protein
MSDFIDFAVVTGAVITGMGLAMSLEWLTLNGLLHLMPSRRERTNSSNGPADSTKSLVSTIHLFPR